MKDLLGRELHLGDLVFTYKKGKKVFFDRFFLDYAIIVGEQRAFNGSSEYKFEDACIVGYNNDELIKKSELEKSYIEYINKYQKLKNNKKIHK